MMDHPEGPSEFCGRPFYRIVPNDDGTVDIWLTPGNPIPMYDNLTNAYDYNIEVLAVRGIEYFDGLEEDVRRRYESWCSIAERIEL